MRLLEWVRPSLRTVAPGADLDIVDDGGVSHLRITSFSDTDTHGAQLTLGHTRGSVATPTATQANDILGVIAARGYDTALGNEPVI